MLRGKDDVIESAPKHKKRISKAQNTSILIIVILYIVVISVLALSHRTKYSDVKTGNSTIHAIVSDTQQKREKGLSDTKELNSNSGMLFVFQNSGNYGFWMKDMKYSLDIVWLNYAKKVNYIKQNLSPATYPNVFFPSTPSQYVLELNSGSVAKLNIRVGQEVNF